MSSAVAIDSSVAILDLVRKVTSLPTLPEITARIVETVENPSATPRELHQIIAHDPSLVTRILKVVNSAFYGLPGQIASIERAIVLLGLNAVKNIAVAASLGQMFRGVKLCEAYTAKDLWKHCVAVAVGARELARQMKLPLADEAFLAGLIHDVGLLVSLQANGEKLRDVCDEASRSEVPLLELERQHIGMDHQQLGSALAQLWRFPRSCQLVAGHHHVPADLPEESRLLVTLVNVSDTICCQLNQGFPLTARLQQVDEGAAEGLGLNAGLLQRFRERLPELVRESAGALV